jgi:hypothetical protein
MGRTRPRATPWSRSPLPSNFQQTKDREIVIERSGWIAIDHADLPGGFQVRLRLAPPGTVPRHGAER